MDRETPEPEKSVADEIARTYREWWPGKMGWAPGSNMSGAAIRVFPGMNLEDAAESMNDWFAVNTGLQVAKVEDYTGDGEAGFYVIYTKTISPEQMAQYDRVEAKAMELLAAEDEAAAAQKVLHEELNLQAEKNRKALELAVEKERNRLVEAGRVHEKNCKKETKKGGK